MRATDGELIITQIDYGASIPLYLYSLVRVGEDEHLITGIGDVTGRRPSGRERPWVSPGRDVPPCQSPNRCQDRQSSHRTRLGGGGGTAMSDPPVCVGIEVSKAQLNVALRPTDEGWHVSHDAPGIATLVERLPTVQPTMVVLEATGGLEVPVIGPMAEAGLPVVVVHPRHARNVAKATGRLAKTDTLDVPGLVHVAEAARPTPRPLPEAQAQALSALLMRRRQLVQRLTAARRRLQTAPQPIRADIQAPMTWLVRHVARTDADVAVAIHASPLWRAKTSGCRARRVSAPSSRGRWSQKSRSWGS
jgi:Transposase